MHSPDQGVATLTARQHRLCQLFADHSLSFVPFCLRIDLLRHYALAALPALLIAATAQAASFTETKLTASDGTAQGYFGLSVAISGTTAIIAAPGNRNGEVYLFDTITGKQTAKLTTDDTAKDDEFGASVAISGTTAIVGAFIENNAYGGAAYLYDTTTGKQTAKLIPGDSFKDEMFGTSVGIEGTTAIVGAPASVFGAAYLFDTTTGKQTTKLTDKDAAKSILFGTSGHLDF